MLPHNVRVLKPREMLVCLLIALAGCSTASRQGSRVPDWSSDDGKTMPLEFEHVAEPPRIAPPPQSAPVIPRPPPAKSNAATWISLNRWSHENQFGSLTQISANTSPAFALKTSNGVLVVQANSLVAKWDGLELLLGFRPELIDGQLLVHELDLKKNIEPLIRGMATPAKTNRTIVIDPGHGGQNTGTTSVLDGTCEKEFTLDWARRLALLLATNGWEVFLTRTDDVDVSLPDRVAFAEKHKADLFISLHFNSAAPSREQAGLEAYCLTPKDMPSTLTRGYADDVSLMFTNNAFDAENLQYAVLLQRALLKEAGMEDRGIRRARFLGVLRGQNRPAVLLEAGYLSNPQEARRIADPAYRQKLAEAVAAALAKPEAENRKPEIGSESSEIRPQASSHQPSNSVPINEPLP